MNTHTFGILKFVSLAPVARSVGHDLRMVLFPVRIRESPLSSPCFPLGDAAYRRDADDCENDGSDGGVDGDLGAGGETGPALGESLGGWTGQSLSDCGVASATKFVSIAKTEPSHERANLLDDIDTLPCPCLVPVFVLLPAREVRHTRALHVHRVRALGIIRLSPGPGDGVIVIIFVPRSPNAQPHVHGRLRKARAAVRIRILQSPHRAPVDKPFDPVRGPSRGVVMKQSLRALDRVPESPCRRGGGVALAVIVRFTVGGVRAGELPVYLVQVVGLEHDAADHALAGGGLEPDLDFAEEDVEFGLHCGGIASVVDGELGAVIVVQDGARGGVPGRAG